MTEPTYNMKAQIRAGLAECRDELEVPSSICSTDGLLDHVLEARNLSAPQCLVLGVFLTMHAQTAIEQATARHADEQQLKPARPAVAEEATGMDRLVGARVDGVYLGPGPANWEDETDDEVLYLATDKGVLRLETEGDCCSHTWWQDILQVKQLIGAVVTRLEAIEMADVPPADAREEDVDYGLRIHTDRGAATFVYRNSSNGYYGGWFNPSWVGVVPTGTRAITEDVGA